MRHVQQPRPAVAPLAILTALSQDSFKQASMASTYHAPPHKASGTNLWLLAPSCGFSPPHPQASMAAAAATRSHSSDAGGFTAAVTESGASGVVLAQRLARLLGKEVSLLSAGLSFLYMRVFTVQQAVTVNMSSWWV